LLFLSARSLPQLSKVEPDLQNTVLDRLNLLNIFLLAMFISPLVPYRPPRNKQSSNPTNMVAVTLGCESWSTVGKPEAAWFTNIPSTRFGCARRKVEGLTAEAIR
jgi:hypothetical protein